MVDTQYTRIIWRAIISARVPTGNRWLNPIEVIQGRFVYEGTVCSGIGVNKVTVAQSRLTLCDPVDYTVHGILQARILEWVVLPFSRGSYQPRDQTQVSRIAGRFFTSYATREAQENWSGQPIPSPADLSNSVIEPASPALQADSLPTELSGKPGIGVEEPNE